MMADYLKLTNRAGDGSGAEGAEGLVLVRKGGNLPVAAIALVARAGGVVAGVAAINVDRAAGVGLRERGYRWFAMMGE